MPCSALIEPAEFLDDVVHDELHLVPFARGRPASLPGGRIEIEMQIAVAQMAEADRPRAGQSRQHGRGRFLDESRDRGHRHRDVVLDRGAFALLRFRNAFAQAPRSCAPAPRSAATTASRHQIRPCRSSAVSNAALPDRTAPRRWLRSAHTRARARQADRACPEYAQRPVPTPMRGISSKAESRPPVRVLHMRQQRQRGGGRGHRGERRDASAPACGNSLRLAAVMTPSVPSAPMKSCLRS